MALLVASWSRPKGPTQNQRFQEDRDYLVSFGITTQEELELVIQEPLILGKYPSVQIELLRFYSDFYGIL